MSAVIRPAPIGRAPVARLRRPSPAGDGCRGVRAPCRLRSDSASDFNGFDDKGNRYRGVVSNFARCVPDKMRVAQTRHALAMRHGHRIGRVPLIVRIAAECRRSPGFVALMTIKDALSSGESLPPEAGFCPLPYPARLPDEPVPPAAEHSATSANGRLDGTATPRA